MRFIIFLILLSLFGTSCKKEDTPVSVSPKEDYSIFLNSREYSFSGTLPDGFIRWKYGFDFQLAAGSFPLGGEERPRKSLFFGLTSNRDLSTRIDISTPSFDVLSDELFSKTIAEGEKEIGGRYDKFALTITLNKNLYTTNGDQTHSTLKVLKMEKSKDEFDRDIVMVWFKVDCTFYSTVDTSSFVLKDGLFLAGFMYNL